MASPFIALDIRDFVQLIAEWRAEQRGDPAAPGAMPGDDHQRWVDAIHLHESRDPNHETYLGHPSIVEMWTAHTTSGGLSDIAQHISIAPDGRIWTGRSWNRQPASATGRNGHNRRGPFMITLIGDFDRDPFEGQQRAAAEWAVAALLDAFDLDAAALLAGGPLQATPTSSPGEHVRLDDLRAAATRHRKWLATDPHSDRDRAAGPPEPTVPGAASAGYDARAEARRWLRLAGPSASDEAGEAAVPTGTPLERLARRTAARGVADRVLDAEALAELRRHVINLTAGQLSRGGLFTTGIDDLNRMFVALKRWIDAEPRHWAGAPKVALVAHGGLVEEKKGLQIALNQLDWWRRNGVYPLFFVWETGLLEEIGRIIAGGSAGARDVFDRSDKLVEDLVRRPGGRIWRNMQREAELAFAPKAGGTQVVERLAALVAERPALEIHAMGHSAGAIFQNHLLPALHEREAGGRKLKAKTVALLAPAVSADAYFGGTAALVGDGTHLAVFTMAKDYELADTVTSLYQKSLLYLISRALEPAPDTALVGLDESLNGDDRLRAHFGLDGAGGKTDAEVIFSKTRARDGRSASQAVRHGDFDGDTPTLDSVMRRVLGLPDEAPVPYSYPGDPVSRGLDAVPLSEVSRADPAAPAPAAATPTGARRALVIGVDDYPDPAARLHGCVADAKAWEQALGALGYSVQRLHDSAATRANIVSRMKTLVAGGRRGDSLVIQFAGHGTQLPDTDADETDDAKDEAFCPVDYATNGFIVDDDFRAVYDTLPAGVALTCFFDCCHSGTITRLGVGKDDGSPRSRPRFIVAPAAAIERHRARVATEGRPPPGDRAAMRHVTFSACRPEQLAQETDGRGDFSRRAVPLLAGAGALTNAAFRDKVVEAFGAAARQHPNLDCPDDLAAAALLFHGGAGVPAADPVPAPVPAPAPGIPDPLGRAAALLDQAAQLLRSAR